MRTGAANRIPLAHIDFGATIGIRFENHSDPDGFS